MDADRRRTLPDRRRRQATPLLLAALGLAYVALSILIWQLSDPTETSAPWWPAAGLTLGVLCRVRRRDWPAVLAVVFAAELVSDAMQGIPLPTSLGWAVADTLEPLLGALAFGWAFRGLMPNIESPGNVLRFFAVALLAGTPVASLIGGATRALSYDVAFAEAWRIWYVGDVLGILVVTPFVLYFPQIRSAFDARVAGMVTAAGLLVAAVSRLEVLRLYLIGPVLVLIAIGLGAPAAIPAVLVTATVGYLFSAAGYGPFALGDGDTDALLGLQAFTAVQALTVFLVVALRAQLLTARAHAERLSEEQLRDPLTGTGSRMLVEDALAEAAAAPGVGDPPPSAAVLFLDLDGFKPVNDRLGHAAGDEVLRTVARRLEDAVRGSDTVGRVGGDEFVVVCRDITPSELDGLARRIRERIAQPIDLDEEIVVVVGASIGSSWASGQIANPSDLLRRADLDMYRRKLTRAEPRLPAE